MNMEKNLISVGKVLFRNWCVGSYNEDTKEQEDYYLDVSHCGRGDIAYMYSRERKGFVKLEIVACLRRSDDMAFYDELPEDTLLDGESLFSATRSAEFITDDDCYLVWFDYLDTCLTGWHLLMSMFQFEDSVVHEIYGTRTYYYRAPKELLQFYLSYLPFPEAVGTELSIEVPLDHLSEPEYASVCISPTIEVDGGTEDCGWCDLYLPPEDVSHLLAVAQQEPGIEFYSIKKLDISSSFIVFWCGITRVPDSLVTRAMEIDGDRYSPERFGISMILNRAGFSVNTDEPGCPLYYVSSTGEWYWLKYSFHEDEEWDIIDGCLEYLGSHFSRKG